MAFFTIFLWLTCFCCCNLAVQIKVQQGVLDGGILRKSRNGTNFYSFYGVPYAKPPVGDLRFEAPQEPDSWNGIRDAKSPPPGCIQLNNLFLKSVAVNPAIGEEDCLYVNIFTPNGDIVETSSSSDLLPVVVFIHGGAFQFGSSDAYHPTYFMDHKVVFVSIQFRLSIFGFLSMADKTLPGNMGLKDQVAALRWIQRNIAAFGGDPKRVTIVGNSSGAMSVHLHMYSPLSVGLFHRAISMSGTALLMGAIIPKHVAREKAQTLGMMFECEPETETLVNCLKKVPAKDLVSALPHFFCANGDVVSRPFAVVIEDENEDGAFLTKNPWRYDAPNRVPWIVGINANEGCLAVSRLRTSDSLLNFEKMWFEKFFYENTVNSRNASIMTVSLSKFYFNNRVVDSQKDIKKIIRLYGDAFYAMSAIEAVRRFNWNNVKQTDNVPVYVYLFDHRNTHSMSEFYGNTTENLGTCHGDDVTSFMYRTCFPPIIDGPDLTVSQRLVNYAVNFIHNGDPNGHVIKEENKLSSQPLNSERNEQRNIWLPVRSSNFEYLHVRTDSDVMEENLFDKRYIFWTKTIFPLLESNA